MGSGALDNQSGSGAGEPPKPARTAQEFLKTQAFYIALVILVLVMGSMRIWKEFRAAEQAEQAGRPPESAGPRPLLQSEFEAAEERSLRDASDRLSEERCRRAVAFAKAVESLSGFPTGFLFWGGCVVAVGIALSWTLHRRSFALPLALEPPWGLWDVAKLAALWVAGAQLLHTRLFFRLNPDRPFAVPGDWMAEVFVAILLVGATIHIVVAERHGHLRDLGIRGKSFAGVAIGLTAFLAIQPFIGLIAFLEKRHLPDIPMQLPLQVMTGTRSASVLALATMVAIVVAPVSEELLFRGFLQPALGRWTGRRLAILLSATFFAAAHTDLYAMPILLALGLALGYLYDRTRSLVAPVALHMAFNAVSLLSVFALRGLLSALRAPH